MQTTAVIVWVYGALVLGGGVVGWLKAGSKASLISGVLFGGALIFVGFGIQQGRAAELTAATVLAGVLTLTMGIRFVKGRKFMPAGLLTILSLVVLALLLLRR